MGGGEPDFELGGGAQVEDAAEVEGVVEGGGLVVEHDVVGAGNAEHLWLHSHISKSRCGAPGVS